MLRMVRYSFRVYSASVDLDCVLSKGKKVNWTRLLWWLGPWCDQQRSPNHIQHRDFQVDASSESFRFRQYSGATVRGAVMVLPGLHPDGVNDPRLDRFCKVLADSGVLVGIPELPTMKRSIMESSVLIDAEEAVRFFLSQIESKGFNSFGLFCISASSIAGLHLGAHPQLSVHIDRLHLFGGFSDWMSSLRFAMTGEILDSDPAEVLVVDPLSLPVVYMNLLANFPTFVVDFVNIPIQLQESFVQCLHSYVSQSWEKPDVHHPKDTAVIASVLLQELLEDCTEMDVDHERLAFVFKQACAIEKGGQDIVHDFLDFLKTVNGNVEEVEWLDPKPLIQSIQMPLDISHGRDDFVVPYPQAHELLKMSSTNTQIFITGLYHHTGVVSLQRVLSQLLGLPQELWTSLSMVKALARLGQPSEQGAENTVS